MKYRIHFKTYHGGHMMYVRKSEREAVNKDLREFILKSLPEPGQPAKYYFLQTK
jgi:hypothetical protein